MSTVSKTTKTLSLFSVLSLLLPQEVGKVDEIDLATCNVHAILHGWLHRKLLPGELGLA